MNTYLNRLKIAVINRDINALSKLAAESPKFSTFEEAEEIKSYIDQALKIISEEKLKLSEELSKLKNIKKFSQDRNTAAFNFKA